MAASALFFSLMAALAKVAGRHRAPLRDRLRPLRRGGASSRAASSSATARGFRGAEPRLLVLRGVLGFGALTCFYYAVVHLPLADATVIHFMNPVFTAFIAAVVLGEHLGLREALLVAPEPRAAWCWWPARPSSSAAAAWRPGAGAGRPVRRGPVRRRLRGGAAPAGRATHAHRLLLRRRVHAAVRCPWSWPMPRFRRRRCSSSSSASGVTTHLGQTFVTWGFRLERAGRASAVGYLQIVFAAGWGWLALPRDPRPVDRGGGGRDRRQHPRARAAPPGALNRCAERRPAGAPWVLQG